MNGLRLCPLAAATPGPWLNALTDLIAVAEAARRALAFIAPGRAVPNTVSDTDLAISRLRQALARLDFTERHSNA